MAFNQHRMPGGRDMPRKILSQALFQLWHMLLGRQADRHEQSNEMGWVQKATRAKSSGRLAMDKARKVGPHPQGNLSSLSILLIVRPSLDFSSLACY